MKLERLDEFREVQDKILEAASAVSYALRILSISLGDTEVTRELAFAKKELNEAIPELDKAIGRTVNDYAREARESLNNTLGAALAGVGLVERDDE